MSRGYALLSTLLLASLSLILLMSVHARLVRQWTQVNGLDGQLHAMIAAQNGIEIARASLPSTDPSLLLAGRDGVFQGTSLKEWRNPVSFADAMLLDPMEWIPASDDGIPFTPEEKSLEGIFHSTSGSTSLFRFSNNPEEPADQDQDRVFIVRSMGIVPAAGVIPRLSAVRNNVALVEARLRKEEAFLPPAAVTLLGNQGRFLWSSQLTVDGGLFPGIGVFPGDSNELLSNLIESLAESGVSDQIRGEGPSPSLSPVAPSESTTQMVHLLSPNFWLHFLSNLPDYSIPSSLADENEPRLAYLPDGGTLDSDFKGLLVSRGDLSLQNRAVVDGILVHIGGGTLRLQENALIRGGLWVCGIQPTDSELGFVEIRIEVNGAARIVFDAESAKKAVGCLPATRLEWRILFPEMLL